ncbi:hypothetical protein FPV67DRAFT_566322 [Lyophyllum atratum]|nr:hypothetical protein FPV67DRAFT_566322 [Lyophyllum atratum]
MPETAAAPTLPQEIIDNIIELFPRDFERLSACSAVAKSFRDPSQKFMFRDANICVPFCIPPKYDWLVEDDEPAKQRLEQSLASSARLSSYVLSLIVRIPNPSASEAYSGMLRNFSRIRSLHIIEAPSTLQLDWATLAPELKTDMLRLLQTPTLTRLDLWQIKGFPLNALRYCPHFTHIRMVSNDKRAVEFDITSDPAPPSELVTNRGSLKVLQVDSPVISQQLQVALCAPSSHLSLTGLLRYETLIASEEGFDQCDTILRLSATSLQEFVVDVRSPIPFSRPLDLSDLHSLSRIRFRSTTYESLYYIFTALESLQEVNTLATVELVIWLEDFAPEYQDVDIWREIGDLLARERHAAHLRRVVINIRDMDDECSESDVKDFLTQAMPKLMSAGHLFIEIGCDFRA